MEDKGWWLAAKRVASHGSRDHDKHGSETERRTPRPSRKIPWALSPLLEGPRRRGTYLQRWSALSRRGVSFRRNSKAQFTSSVKSCNCTIIIFFLTSKGSANAVLESPPIIPYKNRPRQCIPISPLRTLAPGHFFSASFMLQNLPLNKLEKKFQQT